jgi:hypothetical protein
LDGDGNLDLVVVAADPFDGSVSVWSGDGSGSFAERGQFMTTSSADARSIKLVDIDRDGALDLLVADEGSSSLYLFRGDETDHFTFSLWQAYAINGGGVTSVAVGDLDDDGNLDIVVVCQDNTLRILAGRAASFPQPVAQYPTGQEPVGAEIIDFNGDGKLDVITANDYGGDISMLAGDGQLGLTELAPLPTVGTDLWGMATADWDGDGNPDIAVDQLTTASFVGTNVHIFFGDGHGGQRSASDVPVGVTSVGLNWLLTADLNSDGWLDLLGGSSSNAGLSLNEGAGLGTFFPFQVIDTSSPTWSAVVGDFNGDHRPDIVVATMTEVVVLLQQP